MDSRSDRRASRGRGRGSVPDHDDHGADLHHLPFLRQELLHGPGGGAGDLDIRLVGHHLDHRLILADRLPLLHEPLDDLAFGQPLADIRQLEFNRHSNFTFFFFLVLTSIV